MAVNRQTKRSAQGQGPTEGAGSVLADSAAVGDQRPAAGRPRTTPAQFLREVRDELRQVAWPSRVEMVNYSAVVLVTLVVMILLIFALNFVFGKGVFFLFQK